MGSTTLANWIKNHMDSDEAEKDKQAKLEQATRDNLARADVNNQYRLKKLQQTNERIAAKVNSQEVKDAVVRAKAQLIAKIEREQ